MGPLSAGFDLYQRIGELRDRHMSMTLSFETFSTMEPLSSRGRSRLVLVFAKRELQGKHSWLSALRFFCGTFFDSRSLSTNLGLNQRGATRQADEFDTQSQVLAACGETWNPMNLARATRCRSQGDESALNLLQNGICVDELPISSLGTDLVSSSHEPRQRHTMWAAR